MGNADALRYVQDNVLSGTRELSGTILARDESLHQVQMQIEALILANRRKDEFLAMLSDELRTPLDAVGCAVRLLGKKPSEDPTQQRIQALAERQIARLTCMVDELLDVSRITSGKLHLQRNQLDLRDIVSRVVETLEWEFQERRHALDIALPDAPVWLLADAGRLEQVFVNLLVNASRFTDPGGRLHVHVSVESDQAVVRIRDSGIGMETDALPHIFDLFMQGSTAESRATSGLGAGLAVVRNLVELHRGSVTAVSAGPGHGSELTVCLPTMTSCHVEVLPRLSRQ
jgi:two-component system, sensor histidine kinase